MILAMAILAGCSAVPQNSSTSKESTVSPAISTPVPATTQASKYSLKAVSVVTNQATEAQNSESAAEAPAQTALISPKAGKAEAQMHPVIFANMQMQNMAILNDIPAEEQSDETEEDNVLTNNYYSKAQQLEMQIIFSHQEVIGSIDEATSKAVTEVKHASNKILSDIPAEDCPEDFSKAFSGYVKARNSDDDQLAQYWLGQCISISSTANASASSIVSRIDEILKEEKKKIIAASKQIMDTERFILKARVSDENINSDLGLLDYVKANEDFVRAYRSFNTACKSADPDEIVTAYRKMKTSAVRELLQITTNYEPDAGMDSKLDDLASEVYKFDSYMTACVSKPATAGEWTKSIDDILYHKYLVVFSGASGPGNFKVERQYSDQLFRLHAYLPDCPNDFAEAYGAHLRAWDKGMGALILPTWNEVMASSQKYNIYANQFYASGRQAEEEITSSQREAMTKIITTDQQLSAIRDAGWRESDSSKALDLIKSIEYLTKLPVDLQKAYIEYIAATLNYYDKPGKYISVRQELFDYANIKLDAIIAKYIRLSGIYNDKPVSKDLIIDVNRK